MDTGGFIYLITNHVNKKCYVGKTTRSLQQRWSQHRHDAYVAKSDLLLYRAMRRYGESNFSFKLLDVGYTDSELCQLEEQWMRKLNTVTPSGYNIEAISNGTAVRSLAWRQHMSSILRGRTYTTETLERMAKAKIGKEHPSLMKKIIAVNLSTGVEIGYRSIKDAAKDLNTHTSSIFRVLNGTYKQANNYTWRYA